MAGTGSTRTIINRKKRGPFHLTNSSYKRKLKTTPIGVEGNKADKSYESYMIKEFVRIFILIFQFSHRFSMQTSHMQLILFGGFNFILVFMKYMYL